VNATQASSEERRRDERTRRHSDDLVSRSYSEPLRHQLAEVGHLPRYEKQAAPTETESAVHAVAISGRKASGERHIVGS
jgi:hypothetical protein